jgi:hypothetical protein
MRQHLEVADTGHYGMFSGSKFRTVIAPALRRFMREHAQPRRVTAPAISPSPRLAVKAGADGNAYAPRHRRGNIRPERSLHWPNGNVAGRRGQGTGRTAKMDLAAIKAGAARSRPASGTPIR